MKKSVLLLLSAVMTAASAFAQVAKPTVEAIKLYGSTETVNWLDTAAINSEDAPVYLYNVEAGLFLRGGSNWGTRAAMCIGEGGQFGSANLNHIYQFKSDDFGGYKWELAKVTDRKDGTKPQYWSFANKTTSNFLTADNRDGIWVDGGKDRPYNGWYIEDIQSDNSFKLGYIAMLIEGTDTSYVDWGYYGVQYMNTTGDLNTYLLGDSLPDATRWILVSASTYAAVLPQVQAYWAYTSYSKALSDFKAKCTEFGITSIDWTDYNAYLTGEYTYADYKALYDQFSLKLKLGNALADAKKYDAARDWSKFETIFAESNDETEINAAVELINTLVSLKKAIDEGAELDATHDYSAFTTIYNDDTKEKADIDKAIANVNAFISLKKKLNIGAENYAMLDFSEAISVYNNANSTAAQLAAAEANVDKAMSEYDFAHPGLDHPADITSTLTNLDGSNINNWVREFTGEGEIGDFHINTWSGEGDSDGTNMKTPFIEDWKGKGNNLSDQKFYRKGLKVEPGAYKITAKIRLYNESGAEFIKGVYMFGNQFRKSIFKNNDEAQTNAVDGAKYGTYNGMLYYWKDDFEGYTIVGEDGNLDLGVWIEGANFNWTAAKNFRVYKLGDSYDALDYVRQNNEFMATPVAEGTVGTKQLIEDYNQSIPAFEAATDATSLLGSISIINALADSVTKNITAYQLYQDSLTYAQNLVTEKGWSGPAADLLVAYLTGTKGPDANFPNGGAKYVLANALLSTEEIAEETHFLNELLDEAKRTSVAEGDDVTYLLVNPKFGEGTKNPNTGGWVGNQGLGGFKDGDGTATYVVAEQYMGTVNFYQVVKGAPAGIYKIETQAFVRPAGNGNYDSSSESTINTYLYMNQFRTKVPSIIKDGQPVAEAIDHVNCYLSDSTGWFGVNSLHDYNYVEGDRSIYVPNSHPGAAMHFIAGHYNTYTYGLVDDGEDMKIGVTSDGKGPAIDVNGNTVDGSWFLFSGFKLTFMGKNLEAIKEVLAVKYDELLDLVTDNGTNMTNDVVDNDIDPALEKAAPAAIAGVTNADELYELLLEVNRLVQVGEQDIADRVQGKNEYDKMLNALDSLAKYNDEYASLEVYNTFTDLKNTWLGSQDEFMLDWDDDDNEITVHSQYVALIDSMKACVEEMNAATAEAKFLILKSIVDTASDEAPQDLTSYIVNPKIDIDNKATGWTVGALGQNNGYQNNSIYTNGDSKLDQFIECWRSGAVLDDGTIEQTIKLPAGTYTLSADITAKWQGDATRAVEGLYLFARTSDGTYTRTALDTQDASPKNFEVTFKLEADDEVGIGLQSESTNGNWLGADNFKLLCYGTKSEKEPTAIDFIEAQSAAIKRNGKSFENGRIVIYKNGKKFNVTGQAIQ